MEADDFLLDEEILEHDEFLGRKGKNKFKAWIQKKGKNIGKQKLPVRLKDKVLLGGLFGKRPTKKGFGKHGRPLKRKPKTKEQIECLKEYRIMRMQKRRRLGMSGGIRRREMSKRTWLQNCLTQKKVGEVVTLKDAVRGTGVVAEKPKTWEQCHEKTKGMRMRKGGYGAFMKRCYGSATKIKKGQLEEEVKEEVEEIMPIKAVKKEEIETPIVEVPEETKKKKPPYLLYGALGVVAVLVGIRMFKR